MVANLLIEIGQTMSGSPSISKLQAYHFTVEFPKAFSLPITKLYPIVILH